MKYMLIVACILISFCSVSQIDSTKKPLGIKCCKITYEFFNGPQKGTKTLIIDDWGQYTRTECFTESDTAVLRSLNIELNFLSEKQHEVIITTPDSIFSMNPVAKTYIKRIKTVNQALLDFITPEEKVLGTELYLNKPCTVSVVQNFIKTWLWNGICLKKEVLNNTVKIREYALTVDNSYIPEEKDFQIPAGYSR